LSSGGSRPTFEYRFEGAVAELELGIEILQSFPNVGMSLPALGPAASAEMDARVFKVGARTAVTIGRVTRLDIFTSVRAWGAEYHYDGLFAITGDGGRPFSLPGDEGAVVVRIDDGHILGIVVTGSPAVSVACAISPVLEALECSLIIP
jgi:hypothetical protein